MKSSIKNSMKKDEKGKGKLFKVFIKNYFLEILGIIIILVLLFVLLNGRKINYNTNNPSNGKVNTQVIHQKDNSKSIKVNYNKNTYELNKGDFDLFVNESQGIFRVKPSDLLEGNTIIRFSSKVYLIHITGDKEIIDNIVFRFISNYDNLLEKVEKSDNSITLYIRRKENFAFYINIKDKEKLSKRFTKNDTLFYIKYKESSAE